MNIPITGEIGELLREVRAALVDGVGQRVSAAGFGDVRANHDCVFSYLPPQGTRLAELATQSRMAPQSMVWHVDQLERLGYVERVLDPSDRRAKLIRPTKHGLAYMASARDALTDIERQWVNALGTDSVRELRDILRAIQSLEPQTDDRAGAPPISPRADRLEHGRGG
jgi:DNA-binding MarR family transcriptional regulator